MEALIAVAFRSLMYTLFGLAGEVLGAVYPIELFLGRKVRRRVPFKYLEGFVSLWMVPLYALGIPFLFEPVRDLIAEWHVGLRFLVYAGLITGMEWLWGLCLARTLGFFTWDYYAESRYSMGRSGYSLWTLIPYWGLAGLVLEAWSDLVRHLVPFVVEYVLG